MIVVDSSAIVAILNGEPEGPSFREVIAGDFDARISAATLIETGVVALRQAGVSGRHKLEEFISGEYLLVEAVSARQVELALDAFAKYGKGMGNRAGLNFGDCFSYALAKSLNAPLLFKGDDFARTDLIPAI